jgi:hypothetical protein
MTLQTTIASIILTSIIAGLTVGGKSIGKEIALRHSNHIVYRLGILLSYIRKGQKR